MVTDEFHNSKLVSQMMPIRTLSTRQLIPELSGGHIDGANIGHIVFFTVDGPLDVESVQGYYSKRDELIHPTEIFASVLRVLSNANVTEEALALYESHLIRQIKHNNAAVAFALILPDDDANSILERQLGELFHRVKIPFKVAKTEHEATKWVSPFLIRKTGVIPF